MRQKKTDEPKFAGWELAGRNTTRPWAWAAEAKQASTAARAAVLAMDFMAISRWVEGCSLFAA